MKLLSKNKRSLDDLENSQPIQIVCYGNRTKILSGQTSAKGLIMDLM